MKIIARIIIVLLVSTLFAGLLVPYFIDKQKIVYDIKRELHLDNMDFGNNIDLYLMPFPILKISNVKIDNFKLLGYQISSENLDIKIHIKAESLFAEKRLINKITIGNADVDVGLLKEKVDEERAKAKEFIIMSRLPLIELVNIKIKGDLFRLDKLNIDIPKKLFAGKIFFIKTPINISSKFSNKVLTIKAISEQFEIIADGRIDKGDSPNNVAESVSQEEYMNFKINAKIDNLQKLLLVNFPDKKLVKNIIFNDIIDINLNLKTNNGRFNKISIENCVVKSAVINGNGDFSIDLDREFATINAKFDLENIDYNSIFRDDDSEVKDSKSDAKNNKELKKSDIASAESSSNFDVKETSLNKDNGKQAMFGGVFDMIKNLSVVDGEFLLDAKVKKFNISDRSLDNVLIYLNKDVANNLTFAPIAFFSNDVAYSLNGEIKNESEDQTIDGKMTSSGQNFYNFMDFIAPSIDKEFIVMNSGNFTFTSDLKYAKSVMNFANINVEFDDKNTSPITGNILIDEIGTRKNVSGKIETDKVQINSQKISEKIFDGNYVKNKAVVLALIDRNYNINFVAKEVIFDDVTAKNYDGRYEASNNLLKFTSDFTMNQSKVDFGLLVNNKENQFNLDVKYDGNADDFEKFGENIFDHILKFPSLSGFSGKITIGANDILLSKHNVQNLSIDASLANGILKFANANFEMAGGEFAVNGKISFDKGKIFDIDFTCKECSGNYVTSRIMNQSQVEEVSNKIDGMMYINGKISNKFEVVNLDEFLDKISVSGKFVVKDMVIFNFGIEKMSRDIVLLMNKKVSSLAVPYQMLYQNGVDAVFQSGEGSFVCDKITNCKMKFVAKNPSYFLSNEMNLNLKNHDISSVSIFRFTVGTADKPIPVNFSIVNNGKFLNIKTKHDLSQIETIISKYNR